MNKSDKVVYEFVDNKFVQVGLSRLPVERSNFIILSHYGDYDWSGFRSLDACLKQEMPKRPNGFYVIVERL